jgi:broad specificity phosphatase PhoE
VDSEYLEKLGLKERITEVETYQEITERSQRDLTRILNAVDNETFLFIVSHQAFTDRIYVKKDNYATKGQQPGEFCKVDDKFL